MSDASLPQLLVSAFGGGIVVSLLNVGVRFREFRREDHARWISERRAAYAAYIDAASSCIGECAPLAIMADTALQFPDAEDAKVMVRESADKAYQSWLDTLPPRGVLRLLASDAGNAVLADVDRSLTDLTRYLLVAKLSGAAEGKTISEPASVVDVQLSRLVEVARKDIGAR